jgi:hypothetical protein
VDEVDGFTYLGSMVTIDGDSIKEVKTRITKAIQAFAALNNLWQSTKINLKIKCRIFKSNVLSILLYGGSDCF